MTTRSNPLAVAVLCLVFAVGILLAMLVERAAAQAVDAGPVIAAVDAGVAAPVEPASTLPDVAEDPLAAGSTVWKLYKGGAGVSAVIVAAFFLVLLAKRWIKWLNEGNRALYTAGALAALTILAERASEGVTPTAGMLLSAVFTGVALVVNARKPKEAP